MAVENDDLYDLDENGFPRCEDWENDYYHYDNPEYLYERDLEHKQEEGYFGSDFEE